METTVNNFILANSSLLSVSPFNSLSSDLLFTPDEALKIISKGKNRKAPGLDQIFNIMLENIPSSFLIRLTEIFNACISIGYFPKAWKQAVGTMLPKPGKDPSNPSSYRPISLLSAIGKVFEKLIASNITLYLEEINFLNPWQRAYRKNREGAEILSKI